MSSKEITLERARRVLEVVDAGLSHGLGNPIPGQMCVEAAVAFAFDEPHGDGPSCVDPTAVRTFKIGMNDLAWSSPAARAKGMRRIAIAQLGTDDPSFDRAVFLRELALGAVRKMVPIALRSAARLSSSEIHKTALEAAALVCEKVIDLASAAYAAKSAAESAAESAKSAAESAKSAAYAAYAAKYAKYAAEYAAKYAESAAESAKSAAESAKSAAYAAKSAAAYADEYDSVLSIMCEVGVQALKVAGAKGYGLMVQLVGEA